MLREETFPDFDYQGFVEGDDIGQGKVDVVVTEGFAGNIALKAAEGTARQIGQYLRAAMRGSLRAKIGYLFARSAFAQLRERMDPRRANGGVFLGLNGIVIKSHGGSDAEGYASAIEVGHGVVRDELLAKIRAALGRQGRSQDRGSQPGDGQIPENKVLESEVLESDVHEGKAVGGAAS
jgi:glycerol-3-phosphate acyltransferase PlsX